MIDFINLFFILLSIVVLGYFTYSFFVSKKRMSILAELFFIGVYILAMIFFLFPQILTEIENIFGIQSAINFFIYLSIFTIFFIIYMLYNKTEIQRIEITKLTREIAYLKRKK